MKLTLIFLTVAIYFTSCNQCRYVDCPPNAGFRYIIVDSNGDLLSGYNADDVQIIGYRGNNEIADYGRRFSGSTISFTVNPGIDSVLVHYSNNDKDVFIYKNIIYKKDDCCEDFVSNFDMEMNGTDFCIECSGRIWSIKK